MYLTRLSEKMSGPFFVCICLLNISAVCGFLFSNHACYKNIGCFNKSHPFDSSLSELPDSPDDIQVRTFLWTRQNPVEPQELNYLDMSTISKSNFNSSRSTKVLIHGFMSSKDEPIEANLSSALLKKNDYNVIGVDWSKGAKKFYPKAVANTRVTGAVVANLIQTLRAKFGLQFKDLHVIGHSLGAHTAGYVGRRLPGIARITGLDPAGPMFTKTDPIVRLDESDALFVDAIHTDAVPLQDAGFGTTQPMGHQDYFPNGGLQQPGCPPPIKSTVEEILTLQLSEAFDSVSCSHDRAIWYFIESVLNDDCQFTAHPCSSWKAYQTGSCSSCDGSACPVMGIYAQKYPVRGSFYLETNAKTPFCETH